MKKVIVILLVVGFLAGCASSTNTQGKPAAGKENPIYSLVLMREGSQLLQQGQYKEALKKFNEADQVAPGNSTTQNMIGLCHLNLAEYDKALAAFNKALNLVPSFTDAKNNRGLTYLAMGQYRMAEMDFSSVLSDTTYPHHWAMFYNLGLTYLKRGMNAAAEENFYKAMVAPRPVYEAFVRLAQLKAESGDTDEAIRILEDATLKFPGRLEAQFALGRLLSQLGRSDEAKNYLEEVVSAAPSSDLGQEAQAILDGKN